MIDLPESTKVKLHAHPWAESVPRLVAYTRAQARRLVWGGQRGGEMPQGKEAEDIVYGAIAKVLDGSRGWDPDREPDLEHHLRSVCDSELNHLAVGFENRRMSRESAMTPAWIEGVQESLLESTIASPLPEPSEVLTLKAAQADAVEFGVALASYLSDDPPLVRVASLVLDGMAKPAEIAASLGVKVDEVYNMRKRLQRRLPEFMTRWQARERNPGGRP